MHNSFCGTLLLVGACAMAGVTARGQQVHSSKPEVDVAVVYHQVHSNQVGNGDFWMQGASVQFHARVWHGLGGVAELSVDHTARMSGSEVGLDLTTVTFGPRYTWVSPYRRTSVFGQVLAGGANGTNSVFPSSSGTRDYANSLALSMGGGVSVPLPHHLAVRAIEADWIRTQLPNATTNVQNNLRLGAGLAYRF